jgi:hypothetical protein
MFLLTEEDIMKRLLAAIVLTMLALPRLGRAEEPNGDFGKKWEGRIAVNVNGGLQTLSPSFAYQHVDHFRYGEMSGTLSTPGADGRVIDVTAAVRLFRNLGIGLTYAKYRADQLAELTGTIEVGSRELTDAIQVRDLQRTENTVHIQAIYMIPFTARVQLGVYGGPSYFDSGQDVINNFSLGSYGEGLYTYYPVPGFFQTDSASAWGYNVGADLNYYFTRNIGVGFNARYSAATTDYPNPIDQHEIAHGIREESDQQMVPLDMGGLQLVGGVRFRF